MPTESITTHPDPAASLAAVLVGAFNVRECDPASGAAWALAFDVPRDAGGWIVLDLASTLVECLQAQGGEVSLRRVPVVTGKGELGAQGADKAGRPDRHP